LREINIIKKRDVGIEVILATTSLHRRRAFKQLGMRFRMEPSGVDESRVSVPGPGNTDPANYVAVLSQAKACAVSNQYPGSLVIGLDSVGYFEGRILEKPKSPEEAANRLRQLSGKEHKYLTGITATIGSDPRAFLQRVVSTTVHLERITEEDVYGYLQQDGDYFTRSLGYDPGGHLSASFVREIEGNPGNLIWGMPLNVVRQMIEQTVSKIPASRSCAASTLYDRMQNGR
jgi:septum formation protein